jgi:hypothetical protein
VIKLKEDKMTGACCTQGGEEKQTQISAENLKERDHLEDLGVGGKIKLLFILNK